jgi:hypothetical protein
MRNTNRNINRTRVNSMINVGYNNNNMNNNSKYNKYNEYDLININDK